MNGRVYDPTLGRFLSADPTMQYPGNMQNWNRYSYVLNNPHSYTDPSGFFVHKKILRAIGKLFKKVLRNKVVQSIAKIAAFYYGGPELAALVNAGITVVNGGSISDALKSAALTYASYQISNASGQVSRGIDANFELGTIRNVLAHGVLRIVSRKIQSKIQSKINRITDGAGRFIATAAASGAAPILGGGKFANGATTGTFSRLLNGERYSNKSFYEGFNEKFLTDFGNNYPVEHALFRNYASGIDASLWGSDFRHYELAWRNFDSYARIGSFDVISKGAQDFTYSVYGPQNILSSIPRNVGAALGLYNDTGSVYSGGNLVEITKEALNININGPQVINQGTFTKAFGQPYNPGLRSLVK